MPSGLLLGLIGAVVYGVLGPLGGIPYALALIPVVVRGRAVALGALLVGFGGMWTGMMVNQFRSGGTTGENDAAWLAVGLVPLAIGIAILAGGRLLAARRRGSTG